MKHMRSRLNELVAQMEQKEKSTETALQALERELSVKQQVLDVHKKKVSLYPQPKGCMTILSGLIIQRFEMKFSRFYAKCSWARERGPVWYACLFHGRHILLKYIILFIISLPIQIFV